MRSLHGLRVFTLTFALSLMVNLSSGADNTLIEKSIGVDVVEAVVEKIRHSDIFDPDYDFLRRLAYVESRDGESNKTFLPEGYYGGIWQVSERFFEASLTADGLTPYYEKIETEFKINWTTVAWHDLLKPLYSGLAARLFLLTTGEPIPQTKEGQSTYWDKNYNHKDEYDESTFDDALEELENSTVTCSGKMDLVIVLDGSSSVNEGDPGNFDRCKRFIVDLIGTYSLTTVRHGFIVYSTVVDEIFHLDHGLNYEDLKAKVLGTKYPSERTNTNLALSHTAAMFDKFSDRPGVPKVFTILTDGASTDGGVSNIDLLREAGVSSYVIGITSEVNPAELQQLAYDISRNVFYFNNFQILAEFFKRLNAETCKLPQKPEMDSPVQDSLNENERRYYSLPVPGAEGLTIKVETVKGKTIGYYSFDLQNPTSALHDGELDGNWTFIEAPASPRADGQVYISVQGLESANDYVMTPMTGNSVPPTSPWTSTTTEEIEEEVSTDESTTVDDDTTDPTTKASVAHMKASFLAIILGFLVTGILQGVPRM